MSNADFRRSYANETMPGVSYTCAVEGTGEGLSLKKACCVGRHVQQDCPSQLKRLGRY